MRTLIDTYLNDYYKNGTHKRVGQYFADTYIGEITEELRVTYNERVFDNARYMVAQYMMRHDWNKLPEKLV